MTLGILHMDYFFVLYHFIYLMAQLAPHWWSMFFTQQTSYLPYILLISTLWYIGIYTVDILLYSLHFTKYIIPFLPLLLIHPRVFTWVLQPELLLKVITSFVLFLEQRTAYIRLSYCYLQYKGTTIFRTIGSSMWWSVLVHRPSQLCI